MKVIDRLHGLIVISPDDLIICKIQLLLFLSFFYKFGKSHAHAAFVLTKIIYFF